ncbi:hypothetical protein F4X86_01330 [Candidatus Saccharibacteria bacterium]|nr:hypothetical protein [Candidatus Saccharibacteria bacterium]
MNEILRDLEGAGVSPLDAYHFKMNQLRAKQELALAPLRDELNRAIVEAVFANDPEVKIAEEKLNQAMEAISPEYEREATEAMDRYLEDVGSDRWQPWVPEGFEQSAASGELTPLPGSGATEP